MFSFFLISFFCCALVYGEQNLSKEKIQQIASHSDIESGTVQQGSVEHWFDLEQEVQFNPWEQSFIDSLKAAHAVGNQAGLSCTKTTLPRRDKSVYKVGWGPFNAGYGILENDRTRDTLKIVGKVVTNRFVSRFFRVRDYVYSVGSADGLYPYFFEQRIEEDDYNSRRWTLYDFEQATVYRNDNDTTEVYQIAGDTTKTINDASEVLTHNFMTLLYALRNSPLTVGDTLRLPCFVHDKNWTIHIAVLAKEAIDVLGEKYRCIKLQPLMVGDSETGFNRKDKMYLWLTDDSRRLLVLAKAKAAMGYIRAELEYVEVECE